MAQSTNTEAAKKTSGEKTIVKTSTAKEAVNKKAAQSKATEASEEKSTAKTAAASKKTPAKKTTAKKAPAQKATEEKKRTRTTKKTELFIQFAGYEISNEELVARVREVWVRGGNKVSEIITLSLYVKPEEYKAYYVINGSFAGEIDL